MPVVPRSGGGAVPGPSPRRGRHRLHGDVAAVATVSKRRNGPAAARHALEVLNGKFVLAAGLQFPGDIPLEDAVDLVKADWKRQVAAGTIEAGTIRNYEKAIDAFVPFANSAGATLLLHVDTNMVIDFLNAPDAAGEPVVNTQYLRRSGIRSTYTTAICLGLYDVDPTTPIVLKKRQGRFVHALNDEQIERLKALAPLHVADTRTPAALALLMIGASSREAAYARVGDVNLDARRLWLHGGGSRSRDRWIPIDNDWAYDALAARVTHLHASYNGPYPVEYATLTRDERVGVTAKVDNLQAALANTIDNLLVAADMRDPGKVRAASVTEWAAAKFFERTGSLEYVAERLGMSSLDAAAHLVGHDWVAARAIDEPPPVLPAGGP